MACTYRQMATSSLLDVYNHIIFQCILRNRYRPSFLCWHLRVHLKTRRSFNFHNQATSLFHRWCSFRWIVLLLFFGATIPKESFVRWWTFYHGLVVLPRMLLYPIKIGRFGSSKYCDIHSGVLMHIRFRILDICL